LISIGFRGENISFVPISAFHGINLVEKDSIPPQLGSWYHGNSLIQQLDSFKVPKRSVFKPLRVCVYDYYKAMEGNLMGDCI
jgi:elongation factor 1 alpha-like protein